MVNETTRIPTASIAEPPSTEDPWKEFGEEYLTAPAPTPATSLTNADIDLEWVWLEVRKRVFIKLPFSLGVADAMEAAEPIALDGDLFVCGLSDHDYPLAGNLTAVQVRNTIENILRQAAGGRHIQFEVIEGTSLEDWKKIKDRRNRATEAVIAMAEQKSGEHHIEDLLNQIVSEIRQRVTGSHDRLFPQVRAQLLLEIVPSLADAAMMVYSDPAAHDARRSMARVIDRVASFMDIPAINIALEIERYRLEQQSKQ